MLLGLMFFAIGNLNATSGEVKNDEVIKRQTCSRTLVLSNGSLLTITASAGWIFSNNTEAMQRACDKVNEAISGMNL